VARVQLSATVFIQIAIAALLGAGYGLWGLEAVSPLAIPLILWAVMVLLLASRIPLTLGLLIECGAAFVFGFGVVWTVVLGQLLATCNPPACQTADATTDIYYAAALVVPLLLIASGLFAVRLRVRRR